MIRFDDKVAIVTGAGAGLGRSHALALAARGASVIVNDLGGARDGSGASPVAAEAVVAEIKAAGGEAVANGASVTDESAVQTMVDDAITTFGQVDILINNAGILRDKTFAKMSLADFRLVLDVHLMGSVNCTKAVWTHMLERGYGRVVMTTSSSGLYGNFGQSNYGAAKMGLVGLMQTLAIEGQRKGVHVNAIAPVAATRMTEDVLPDPKLLALLEPTAVTAGVLTLVDEAAPTRTILCAGAGGYSKAEVCETRGIFLPPDQQAPETIRESWDALTDIEDRTALDNGRHQTERFLAQAIAALGSG